MNRRNFFKSIAVAAVAAPIAAMFGKTRKPTGTLRSAGVTTTWEGEAGELTSGTCNCTNCNIGIDHGDSVTWYRYSPEDHDFVRCDGIKSPDRPVLSLIM